MPVIKLTHYGGPHGPVCMSPARNPKLTSAKSQVTCRTCKTTAAYLRGAYSPK